MSLAGSRNVQNLRGLDERRLAKIAGLSLSEFRSWLARGDCRFHPTRPDTITGKLRLLDVPRYQDMRIFRRINKRLQKQDLFHRCAHGGVRGRSSFTSAGTHAAATGIWLRDITDCFPSVTVEKFRQQLQLLGIPDGVQETLTRLFTCRGRLPQGCPTSNAALNIFFLRVDHRMSEYCGRRFLSFTRMADDIVIGGRNRECEKRAADKLISEIEAVGLEINEAKREKFGFQTDEGTQLVHSLEISTGKLLMSEEHRQIALSVASRTVGACRSLQPASLQAAARYRNQLHGWYYYSTQTKDQAAAELKRAIHLSDEHARSKLLAAGLNCKGWRWWLPGVADRLQGQWLSKSFACA